MLVEMKGNVLKDPQGKALITIPVNSVGVAGKGMALWMKLAHPNVYKQYVSWCRKGKINHGEMMVVDTGKALLAMFPTKYHWSGTSDVELIRKSAVRLLEYMKEHAIKLAHLPHVGCGLRTGELIWETDVKPIFEDVLTEWSGYELRVYKW